MNWKTGSEYWKRCMIEYKSKTRKSNIYLIGIPERNNMENKGKKIFRDHFPGPSGIYSTTFRPR